MRNRWREARVRPSPTRARARLRSVPRAGRIREATPRLPRGPLRVSVGGRPDRDVLAALARERLAIPAAPALAQAHACELGHQVELRRPYVAERHREEPPAPVDEREVVRDEALVRDVVLVDTPVRRTCVEDVERLTRRQAPKAGHADLDHEGAAGLEVPRDVAEARDLTFTRREVVDRVEDEVRERESPLRGGGREIPDRDADVLPARLLP